MTSSATPALASGSAARLRHVVQFYGANDELVEGVSAYLHDGLIAGGTVIVVATPAHQSAFANALSNAGVDVAAAIFEDRLIQRDASELLSRFSRGDTLGHAEFEELMEKLVGPALERGGPVRISTPRSRWDCGSSRRWLLPTSLAMSPLRRPEPCSALPPGGSGARP